jgi:colicin import membrane protein
MRRVVALLVVTASLACAAPPSKEMDQAQGAIDAARAAGAEQFAATELTAAVDALRRSEAFVAERDYRQALNYAIESRERAQAAAKAAVDARARARGDAEALLAEATTLLAQARARLKDADAARVSRRIVQEARRAIEAAQTSVQNARTALDGDDYARARKTLDGVSARIQAAMSQIADAIDPAAARRRR